MTYIKLPLALILSFSAFVSYAQPVQFTYQDQTIQLQNTPQKLAVYELSALDTLNALGIQASIVPETTFVGALKKFNDKQYVKAGSLFEPNQTLLKEQKPDLIIVGGRSAAKLNEVIKIAPAINLWPDTQNFNQDLKNRTLFLAKMFNKEQLAQSKLDHVYALQAQLKQLTKGKSGLMLFAMGDNFIPHAKNERFGFAYDISGLKSVVPPAAPQASSARPAPNSPEALAAAQRNLERLVQAIKQNPDFIIVLDRGAVNTQNYAAKQHIQSHPLLKNSQAVKENRVIFVDADAWYLTGAGLDNTAFMLEELINGIKNTK